MANLSNKRVEEIYNELSDFFGEKLANFETHPRIFAYQVKLYKYLTSNKEQDKTVDFTRQRRT
jgi:hypothetical protein